MNSNVFKAQRVARDRYVKFTLATRTSINPDSGQPFGDESGSRLYRGQDLC